MTPRKIVRRTRCTRHGEITRLMSSSDVGQVLKPFVFMDHFDLHGAAGGTELHPHSGIVTVTCLFELAIFEASGDAIDVTAESDAEFVIGSAVPHSHDLVLGNYSVHTSVAALRAGEKRLKEIQRELQRQGRL